MSPDDYRILKREYGDGRVEHIIQKIKHQDNLHYDSYWVDFKTCLSETAARDELNKILKDMIIRETVMK